MVISCSQCIVWYRSFNSSNNKNFYDSWIWKHVWFCRYMLLIFKKKFPQRQDPGMFKLNILAEDLLKISGYFHKASFWCTSLTQKLSTLFISVEKLLESKKIIYEIYV